MNGLYQPSFVIVPPDQRISAIFRPKSKNINFETCPRDSGTELQELRTKKYHTNDNWSHDVGGKIWDGADAGGFSRCTLDGLKVEWQIIDVDLEIKRSVKVAGEVGRKALHREPSTRNRSKDRRKVRSFVQILLEEWWHDLHGGIVGLWKSKSTSRIPEDSPRLSNLAMDMLNLPIEVPRGDKQ
jgi:hypothetical protein